MATTQAERLLSILSDKRPHRSDELLKEVYGAEHLGIARLGARVFDLRQSGKEIKSWRDKAVRTLTWYQLCDPKPQAVEAKDPQQQLLGDGTVSCA